MEKILKTVDFKGFYNDSIISAFNDMKYCQAQFKMSFFNK